VGADVTAAASASMAEFVSILQVALLAATGATHCNTLQHTATHCNTLQHTAPHRNAQQHAAPHCNTQQHNAPHCNTREHTETHGNTVKTRHYGMACALWHVAQDTWQYSENAALWHVAQDTWLIRQMRLGTELTFQNSSVQSTRMGT